MAPVDLPHAPSLACISKIHVMAGLSNRLDWGGTPDATGPYGSQTPWELQPNIMTNLPQQRRWLAKNTPACSAGGSATAFPNNRGRQINIAKIFVRTYWATSTKFFDSFI